MMGNIIVGVLALCGTVLGSLITGVFTSSKTEAVLTERIRSLEEKVEKHNSLVERTYKLESDVRTAFVQIDEIKHYSDK